MEAVKFPQVWDENGKPVEWDVLKAGYLVQISPAPASLGDTELLGIYRGVEDYECGLLLLLKVAKGGTMACTADRMCLSAIEKYDFGWINLVEILARDFHAASELFHAHGVLKVKHEILRKRVKDAVTALGYRIRY